MEKHSSASGGDLADLIVYLARLGQTPGACAGQPGALPSLTAAQWTALRYFAQANRFSRTPSGFSQYHATTRGTASQTVKSLVTLGLLSRRTHQSDGRSTVLDVTEAGQALLRHDPLKNLRQVLARLPQETQAVLASALGQAIADLAQARDAPVFGTCSDCSHCEADNSAIYCHCTQSMLTQPEMHAICVDFQPARQVPQND
ncbi:MarR family winged helix-turn-helix transcriptional regulator [Roseinatronobacter bogoriensis]|uniref:MarR family transcriptional regulator n=1 Tax=Roseinatronobacter bogoriensis subsp. barguzinensis TaxID=441209 RepID=A0A2K8KJ38_9RHOB|nr:MULTISPECIES: MarR family winged helix-turn-helix transcriptional regulator [Rhodobaca]ATX66170.1 MarR family transcriptional regulator [Rhodobaca barguzinensis]MBB4207210.1 DNA-binding MarR family transcriptional regulator [Rhodobaca bogoriensis DSM 18756]TDW40421.1 DNA-binding MarR family transcriptional regulator [Rhodobaca barguzinensis]TDY70427.1 MarR family transcriptional regulator [Rhodobaca bogoriensis DSM 18756]